MSRATLVAYDPIGLISRYLLNTELSKLNMRLGKKSIFKFQF